jgi:hypothetical protein
MRVALVGLPVCLMIFLGAGRAAAQGPGSNGCLGSFTIVKKGDPYGDVGVPQCGSQGYKFGYSLNGYSCADGLVSATRWSFRTAAMRPSSVEFQRAPTSPSST